MKLYGLIGYPLGHSFSMRFFTEKFEAEHNDARYVNFEIADIGLLPQIVASHPDLQGLNVTLPYKEQVIQYLDELDAQARQIGAVNVIRVERSPDGKPRLTGHNTDVVGFCRSIGPLLNDTHRKALILGTGGASKAVCCGLQSLGLSCTFVSRHPRGTDVIGYGDLTPEVMASHTVVVNCTPVGMFPHADACPSIPYAQLGSGHLLYDLVYNPLETKFLQNGKAQGAQTKNGLEMLHLQALAAWEIWNR